MMSCVCAADVRECLLVQLDCLDGRVPARRVAQRVMAGLDDWAQVRAARRAEARFQRLASNDACYAELATVYQKQNREDDRQALIDAVFVGQGSPAQPSIREGDPLYNEQLAKAFTEFDPDRANQMLDALIPNRDGDGYRLDAEGRRLSIIFEIDQTRTTFLDMFELAIPMFQAVGIDALINRYSDAHIQGRAKSTLH